MLKKRAKTDNTLYKLFIKGLLEYYTVKIVKKINLYLNYSERANFGKAYILADKL